MVPTVVVVLEPTFDGRLALVLLLVAVVLGVALLVLAGLTLGWSVARAVRSARRDRVRDGVRETLVEGVFDLEFDWATWVKEMSEVERAVVETELNQYIRELDGKNAERLRELGVALELPERSGGRLSARDEFQRLRALTWLCLLHHPAETERVGFEAKTMRERAVLARLRYETDGFDDPREGIRLLVAERTAPLSVFAQDTLYTVALEEPAALFEVAGDTAQTWSDSLLVQVLVVCQHIGSNVTTEELSWVTSALEHDNERVRKAAALALGNLGWRRDLRSTALVDRLLEDPAPRVRSAVYTMLARWGDERALDQLADALRTESDARARLAGTDALATQRDRFPGESTDALDSTWRWSREHVEFDRSARQPDYVVSR